MRLFGFPLIINYFQARSCLAHGGMKFPNKSGWGIYDNGNLCIRLLGPPLDPAARQAAGRPEIIYDNNKSMSPPGPAHKLFRILPISFRVKFMITIGVGPRRAPASHFRAPPEYKLEWGRRRSPPLGVPHGKRLPDPRPRTRTRAHEKARGRILRNGILRRWLCHDHFVKIPGNSGNSKIFMIS